MSHWNTELPHPLNELHELEFDYADGEGIDFEPYSAFLSADETSYWFRAWTGNKEVDGAEFRVFGQDGTGGYAAFWLIEPDRSILEQPIVFLGSEGETGVVAANFGEYLWLLAAGIGPYEAVAYPGLEREPNGSFVRFAQKHSATGPLQPEQVLASASSRHPGFTERVQSLCR
jgi:hypothetical protein